MKAVRSLCLLLAMCLSGSFAQDDGYETFPSVQGSRYKLYLIHLTWAEAYSICQGDGGGSHLIIINSEEEAEVVRELASRIPEPEIWGLAVGMSDLVHEGTWATIEGDLVSLSGYNKWADTEPDGGTDQNCGYAQRSSLLGSHFCSALFPFICEKPVV